MAPRRQSFATGLFILLLCVLMVLAMIFVGYELYGQIASDLTSAIDTVTTLVITGASGIVEAEQYIQDKAGDALSTIASQTTSTLGAIESGIVSVINGFIEPTGGFVAQVINLVNDQVTPMIESIIATIVPIVNGIENLLTSIMNFIFSLADDFIDFINGVISLIVSIPSLF